MDTKVLLAALAGTVVAFFTGWLIWGMALQGFMDSNTAEAARGIMRGENMLLWAIAMGCLALSILLTVVFSYWASISTFKSGAIAGLWMCFLIALSMDLFSYASMNIMSLTAYIVDAIASAVQGALIGGVIGWALGYGGSK